MRVLHVAESAKGGVGTYLAELAPLQMAALGARNVRMLVPDRHAAQLGDVPAEMVISYSRDGRNASSLNALHRALAQTLAEFRPDVVHAHSTFAGLAVRGFYGWRHDRPRIVYCPHGWAFNVRTARWKRSTAAIAERALSLFCDRVIAISQHEANEACRIGIPAERIDLVLNGMSDAPPAIPAEWDDSRLRILFVGRLDRQKGFDTLMDAIAPLKGRVSVRVAGESVVNQRWSMGNFDHVEHLGWLPRDHIHRHLAAADALVVPSRWEGFGLVALEAMRAGRMVIASKVGGLPEVVSHGETGWLMPPDSPVTLSRLLTRAMKAPRDWMGENGRKRFLSRFTADRMNAQLLGVYDRSCRVPATSRQPVLG